MPFTYPDCIRKLYESESNGEKIYSALLRAAKGERDRYHFATLLQLESETKARLQPFLFKYGVAYSTPDIQPFVDGAVSLYVEHGWQALMAASRPVVQKGIAEFEAIAAIGLAEDADVLQGMVRHEKAILQWVDAELAGSGDDSLRAVIAELAHPIPRDAGAAGERGSDAGKHAAC
ncbi:hypothetical protein [Ramlibacter albus]|uniref:Uncharacterized protein n=1 Tax=Ramlibacter albus TaxID=2079448 RepID=A0A923M930_9BURK|nr:hypothetical protein [Ramlibacter albus]MBC5766068.1 hypothetical protein [Ramlibacter albus]